ncbi:ferrochelatase [Microbacterium sp. SA075R]|uniref:ferrochelatase n=1 Tax=Microbacterium sp. SA075R TaxID=3121522 RepID=UPI003BA1A5FF
MTTSSTPTQSAVPFASPAAAGGDPFVEVPVAYDAIVLSSFGGPEGQDDVIPFLRNVTHGRGIPDERLEEVAHHYRHFGGVSPINAQNRALKAALEAEIARRGLDLPVYWGNRNWAPRVLAETGLGTGDDPVTIDKVRLFFDHPGFVEPFYEGVRDAVAGFLADGVGAGAVRVLFSTHSIPTADADRSGPRDRSWPEGGAYAAQHRAVAAHIMQRLADEVPAAARTGWDLVFQSRSGPASQPWLEPDVNDVIAGLPAQGVEAVAIVPLGFVSDHMEVLWDLDNEAMASAAESGIRAVRTRTPGTHPAFVAGLVDLVEERLHGTPASERPHLTDLGPWYDVARPGDCENARLGFLPAAAGVAP